jgi:hypothetical protein
MYSVNELGTANRPLSDRDLGGSRPSDHKFISCPRVFTGCRGDLAFSPDSPASCVLACGLL